MIDFDSFFNWIEKGLVRFYRNKIFKPEPVKALSHQKVRGVLHKQGIPHRSIRLSDSSYFAPTRAQVERFLSLSFVDQRKYVSRVFDCDNFSFALMGKASAFFRGFAFGIVWAETKRGLHALNFFIDDEGIFWYVEPQSDFIFRSSDYKPYFALL